MIISRHAIEWSISMIMNWIRRFVTHLWSFFLETSSSWDRLSWLARL